MGALAFWSACGLPPLSQPDEFASNTKFLLPLVANYSGTMINVSFQGVNKQTGAVDFYGPVFKGVSYKHAAPVDDYISGFIQRIQDRETQDATFSYNCVLNYLHSELEGKETKRITGPVTFGEIAYQLLNQTAVTLQIKDL